MATVNYDKLNCPIAKCLGVLGDQWTFLIVRDALSGKTRFNDFQESLGISRNLLSRRLQHLCALNLLERQRIPHSKRYQYVATEKCRDLRPVILSMADWAVRWIDAEGMTKIECSDQNTGNPVQIGFVDTQTNQKVAADAVIVKRFPAI